MSATAASSTNVITVAGGASAWPVPPSPKPGISPVRATNQASVGCAADSGTAGIAATAATGAPPSVAAAGAGLRAFGGGAPPGSVPPPDFGSSEGADATTPAITIAPQCLAFIVWFLSSLSTELIAANLDGVVAAPDLEHERVVVVGHEHHEVAAADPGGLVGRHGDRVVARADRPRPPPAAAVVGERAICLDPDQPITARAAVAVLVELPLARPEHDGPGRARPAHPLDVAVR